MLEQRIAKTPLECWVANKLGQGSSQQLIREDIEQYQLSKLNETISMAYCGSPFYRRHLAGIGQKPLATVKELAHYPFTTADDLKIQGIKMLCVSQSEISRVVTLHSSGTTGEAKQSFFTADDQEQTIDFFQFCMSTLVGAQDRVLILLPGERPGSVGDLLRAGIERLGATAIPHGVVRNIPATLAVMAREQVTSFVGIPLQALALARYCVKAGNLSVPLKNVLLSTDYVSQAVVRELKQVWHCQVFDHYGMTEMGLGGGMECAAHGGYHLRDAELYFEIINPDTGEPVTEGEWGEVVFTTLTRRGMPLIRYRTGDISRFIPEPCRCGTLLRRLAPITVRVTGTVRIGEQSWLTMADLDEALLPLAGIIDFTATVTYNCQQAILAIWAVALELYEGQLKLLQAALRSVASICRAEQAGELTIGGQIEQWNEEFLPPVGKRTIKIVGRWHGIENSVSGQAWENSTA
ncbi:MAG TPA: AMP-binding protein [Negativicutes bacterium]